ncbi:MAG: hypothetical protein AABZ74_16030 [Cyanobacteriota bacterium]
MEIFNHNVTETKSHVYINSYEFKNFKTSIKLNFNESINLTEKEKLYFVFLISDSISLTKEEKIEILFKNLAHFSSFQFFELVRIIEEEKKSLSLLSTENSSYIKEAEAMKLEILNEWRQIEKL